jgi:quinol monooxygenase YgiN
MAGFGAVVTFKVPAGQEAEFERLFAEAREFIKKEKGWIAWDLFKDQKQEGVFFIVELYADKAAFDAHVANPDLKVHGPKLQPFMTERTVVLGGGLSK